MPEEKIIAVIGAPRSGKTFLVNKLASVLGAQAFLEGYGDKFPKFIEDDIKNSENNLRRILWFRNRQISHLLEAVKLKKIQKGVVLDTFWVDNQMYVDVLLSGHDKDVVNELIEIDLKTLQWPDIIIYLKNNKEGTKKFTELGSRNFDMDDSYQDTIALLQQKYEKIFALVPSTTKLIVLERSNIDFERKNDLDKLVQLMSV
ncbi:MAG: hypothetical protein A2534_02265 [Candidatus Magasanikbacteria bacterium RIFOXYD2_FULL_39_9]|uniref:NadR/Ttd14 AAA domain-containing protein n=1 Tax=Candidatus Magasanikbacteria bacterium RIFOXYD1_FULL_40_23 TaxID=1798705 RepID=A0A1F6PB15_9BACT|nr:MAG: hypothetical protein A2534_02265 [Candidatus Magasanikbacteria bacterium RIFOXYD2_FULL_39_9]OGH93351.1 MAG: hypothetical protein A2563_01950 [Candidatus Magasanikbacteria bacterium RIFOXYD1_FULL_40_23]